jgi:hypothetical protein
MQPLKTHELFRLIPRDSLDFGLERVMFRILLAVLFRLPLWPRPEVALVRTTAASLMDGAVGERKMQCLSYKAIAQQVRLGRRGRRRAAARTVANAGRLWADGCAHSVRAATRRDREAGSSADGSWLECRED